MTDLKTMDVIRDCSPTRPKLTKISDRHPKSVLENFTILRRNNELCDVLLNVGNSKIRAHKIILCASSPYFKAMFTNELAESKQTEVTIKDIDENAMEMLIDFCYSSKITIDEKIVQSLLPAACLLQLQEVQDYCSEFLKSQLDPSNCLGIRAFADTHSCRELLKIADKYLQNNFIDVVESDEFLLLPVNQLLEIISNDELNVRCEEQVYQAVMNWIKYDLDERKQYLAQLMSNVRLPLLDTKFLVTKVGCDPLVRQDQTCRDLIDEAKDYHLLPQERSLVHATRIRPRKPVITGEVLFAVGGWCSGDAIASVEMFDPQSSSNEWKIVASMSKRRCGVGVGVLNDQIYAIGGHDGSTYLNSTERYDPMLNQWFSDVAPTASCRTSVGVAVMDGYLYAVGGQDGVSCLNIVDKYDPSSNRWSRVASMNSKRLGVAVVVLGTFLYAVGGSDGTSPLNTVERYDAKNNKWTLVAPMLTRRKHLGCAVYKNYIYAVGGRDDAVELNSAERYDPQTNQWQPVVSMKSRRSGVGLAVVNGTLMAIGGFDGTTYLKTCEIYDPDANVWKLSGSMIYRRLGGGVGVVKLQKEGSNTSSRVQTASTNTNTSKTNSTSTNHVNVHRGLPHVVYNISNMSTNPSTNGNSWPFILSPMPSILSNVNSNGTSHLSNLSTNRPIQSPTNTNGTISIATITTSDSLMGDLNGINTETPASTSPNNRNSTSTAASTSTPSTSSSSTSSSEGANAASRAGTSVKLVDV